MDMPFATVAEQHEQTDYQKYRTKKNLTPLADRFLDTEHAYPLFQDRNQDYSKNGVCQYPAQRIVYATSEDSLPVLDIFADEAYRSYIRSKRTRRNCRKQSEDKSRQRRGGAIVKY